MLKVILIAGVLGCLPVVASAQTEPWPNKSIR
jgi:hypothetical protein